MCEPRVPPVHKHPIIWFLYETNELYFPECVF